MKSYKARSRFQYIALSDKDEETYQARIRRLVTFSPRINKSEIPIRRLPKIRLVNNTEEFILASTVPKHGKEYIRLNAVAGCYIPLVSAHSQFTFVVVSLHDTRNRGESSVQSVKFNSNLSRQFELSLDYWIPRKAAHNIILKVGREVPFHEEGEQWATVCI
ncbi:hypothetical protein Droror1_Dr00011440 [Drosera rotundifolia]